MPAYKNKKDGTWYVSFYFVDSANRRRRKLKRGFKTRKEALCWESDFQNRLESGPDTLFADFLQTYISDKQNRLRDNTWCAKGSILRTKLLPFFGCMPLNAIGPQTVLQWQNHLLAFRTPAGKGYSPAYIRAINNQLCAVMNHACRYYGLKGNPVSAAGAPAAVQRHEMNFWTREEYARFSGQLGADPLYRCAFDILYWCGLREGELLALTPSDLDFSKKTIRISKSMQRIKKENRVTPPKTLKSNRIVYMPDFLAGELQAQMGGSTAQKSDEPLFVFSRYQLRRRLKQAAEKAALHSIRIHDLRHSHISLLIDLGFSAVAIADRVGHESIGITYRYAHLFPSRQTDMVQKLDCLECSRPRPAHALSSAESTGHGQSPAVMEPGCRPGGGRPEPRINSKTLPFMQNGLTPRFVFVIV